MFVIGLKHSRNGKLSFLNIEKNLLGSIAVASKFNELLGATLAKDKVIENERGLGFIFANYNWPPIVLKIVDGGLATVETAA